MRRLKWILLVSLMGTGSAFAADAQQVEPAAAVDLPFSWTGFYAGAEAGYSWFDARQTFPGVSESIFHGDPSLDTFTLGGQVGYRYQFGGGFVVGIEGDLYSYFGKNTKAPLIGAAPNGVELKVNYGGSLRGQLGYAFDRFLPYVTGGVAFVDYEGGSSIFFGGPIFPSAAYSETKAGWTVGAGLAYAMTDHLIANIDYRYADFGSSTFATPGAFLGQTKLDLKENTVKIGLSYKF